MKRDNLLQICMKDKMAISTFLLIQTEFIWLPFQRRRMWRVKCYVCRFDLSFWTSCRHVLVWNIAFEGVCTSFPLFIVYWTPAPEHSPHCLTQVSHRALRTSKQDEAYHPLLLAQLRLVATHIMSYSGKITTLQEIWFPNVSSQFWY